MLKLEAEDINLGAFLRGEYERAIISFYDMIATFDIVRIGAIVAFLMQVDQELEKRLDKQLDSNIRAQIKEHFENIKVYVEQLNIGPLSLSCEVLEDHLNQNSSPPMLLKALRDMMAVFSFELTSIHCFLLRSGDSKYFQHDAIPQTIRDKLGDCTWELEEANKCCAFGRSTASVFHSMRALEVMLPILADMVNEVGGAYDRDKALDENWSIILEQLRKELKNIQQVRKEERDRNKLRQLGEIIDRMSAIKDARRNKTMHSGHMYTDEEADEILTLTKTFLNYVAEMRSQVSTSQP